MFPPKVPTFSHFWIRWVQNYIALLSRMAGFVPTVPTVPTYYRTFSRESIYV